MLVLLPVFLVLISSLTYRCIEHPMIRTGKRLSERFKRFPATP